MRAEQLKASILQCAVQGRLVGQHPEDGSADNEIEKAKLLKNELNSKGILKGRKIKELIPIKDEVPFDIPETWRWVRLGSIVEIFGRIGFRGYTKNDIVNKGEGAITMSPSNINQDTGEIDFSDSTYLSWEKYEESPEIMLEPGNIVLVKTGSSYGKCGIVRELLEKATINPQLAILKYVSCDNNYLNWVLRSPSSRNQYEQFVTGTSIPTFSQEKLANMFIPLPPVEEQHRIVTKIEELLPYVDRYAEAYEKLEQFNAKFPEDMKKSILQYAIHGKLVEQRPEEGTAEDLYQQIQDEKQRLIKEGKIKKEKPLAEITEDEIPFDIPESWKWCRIGSIFTLQAGKNITASDIHDNQDENNKYLCYGGNGIRGFVNEPNRHGHYAIIGRQGALCGCINFAEGDFYATEHAVVVEHYNLTDTEWGGLFLKALNLNQYATATAQPGLAVANINQVLIPLPPLEEQHRIVAKIEELLQYCDKLTE